MNSKHDKFLYDNVVGAAFAAERIKQDVLNLETADPSTTIYGHTVDDIILSSEMMIERYQKIIEHMKREYRSE